MSEDIFDPVLVKRFWEKVDVRGPEDCWLWTAARTSMGYGRISIHGVTGAHRYSLALVDKVMPHRRVFALHSCDTPLCVNPNHLRWGSYQDNADDCGARNRVHRWNGARSGERNPLAVLTKEKVQEIRATYRPRTKGRTIQALADKYGVGYTTIHHVLVGATWKI